MIKDKTKIVPYGSSQGFHLPADIYKDSAFPFKESDDLEIEIDGKEIRIRKAR